MDYMIQQGNFLHDDRSVIDEFKTNFNKWTDCYKEAITAGHVISAFQTLSQRLIGSKCPTYRTEGWNQAVYLLKKLEDLTVSQMAVGNINSGEFHEFLYRLMIDWFQCGPSTVSLELIIVLHGHKKIGMKEFTKNLKGERLDQLLRAITSPLAKNEDTPDKEYYSAVRARLGTLWELAFDIKAQLIIEDSVKLLMDFVYHLHLDYLHLDDKTLEELDWLAKRISKMCSENWKTFSDIPRLQSYIQKFTTAAKTKNFPRSKVITGQIYDSLTKLTFKLRDHGPLEPCIKGMLDLMDALSQATGEKQFVLKVFSGTFRCFYQRKDKKTNPAVFKAIVPRFISLVSTIDLDFIKDTSLVGDIMDTLDSTYALNHELTGLWLSLSVPLMRRQTLKTFKGARGVLCKHDKIRWKEHEPYVKELLAVIKEIEVPNDDSKESSESMVQVSNCIEYLVRGLKRAKILRNYGETLMFLSIHLLELRNKELFDAAEEVGEHIEIEVKERKEAAMKVMGRLLVIIKDEDLPWNTCADLHRAVGYTFENIFKFVKDVKMFSDKDLTFITSMCVTCLEKDVIDPDSGAMSPHFSISLKIMNYLIPWITELNKVDLANKIIPFLIRALHEDDDRVPGNACTHLTNFATQKAGMVAPYFNQILEIGLDKEMWSLLGLLNTVYSNTRVSLKKYFKEMLTQLLETNDKQVKGQMPMILWTASKKEPDLFTEQNMKDLIDLAKSNQGNQAMLLQLITDVCKRRPGKLIKHREHFMNRKDWNPMIKCILNDILSTLALYDKSISGTIVDHFINIVSTESDKGVLLTALNAIRMIAFKNLDVVKPKRERIEKLQIIDADAQMLKMSIIDIIDGKTPEGVRKQLAEQQEAISGLMNRVENVEETVDSVVVEMKDQRQDLDNVKNDVTEQSQRLDQVEEVVDETVKKVEEIDSKTLSHAPYWSRDISKLLNPVTKHDWRLLSSRLGYSNADVRGWAQQADPCMAMLNEWYATRKTSEATQAILTHLQEMNREDAALIVENAMKKAEAVVEDEEFEYASPPEIFISYQWGHQDEVKLLHRHLGMAGYDCWMDIGQMGGGDKLFEKIDNGMRAAKLVISCVTAKYAKSPNCNREVNLAVGVKKPIIPLLFENCTWPPPGSMGPIFSESLYIQFFQTDQQETKDNRFWPVEKFQELLMQLSVNGLTPDEGKIHKVYRNWWMPLEEKITIDKSKTRNGGKQAEATQNGGTTESERSPDVFISYQWGKQKNIIKLYQRLTSLGFSCWLDIKQMGGGDSLYDKIDRGIRGCKVVVSCVTKKYALSPNCRREVSLTDALKKPLLPLLLEEMTWPPTGPMGLILTQLLYIGFQQESAHTNWKGPQFDELINKINEHAPQPLTEQSNKTSRKENNTSQSKEETAKARNPKPEYRKIDQQPQNSVINNDPGHPARHHTQQTAQHAHQPGQPTPQYAHQHAQQIPQNPYHPSHHNNQQAPQNAHHYTQQAPQNAHHYTQQPPQNSHHYTQQPPQNAHHYTQQAPQNAHHYTQQPPQNAHHLTQHYAQPNPQFSHHYPQNAHHNPHHHPQQPPQYSQPSVSYPYSSPNAPQNKAQESKSCLIL